MAAHEVTLVQKDARTVVIPADGRFCYINTCGNSGMSTGGSGDVLAGIIGEAQNTRLGRQRPRRTDACHAR